MRGCRGFNDIAADATTICLGIGESGREEERGRGGVCVWTEKILKKLKRLVCRPVDERKAINREFSLNNLLYKRVEQKSMSENAQHVKP